MTAKSYKKLSYMLIFEYYKFPYKRRNIGSGLEIGTDLWLKERIRIGGLKCWSWHPYLKTLKLNLFCVKPEKVYFFLSFMFSFSFQSIRTISDGWSEPFLCTAVHTFTSAFQHPSTEPWLWLQKNSGKVGHHPKRMISIVLVTCVPLLYWFICLSSQQSEQLGPGT